MKKFMQYTILFVCTIISTHTACAMPAARTKTGSKKIRSLPPIERRPLAAINLNFVRTQTPARSTTAIPTRFPMTTRGGSLAPVSVPIIPEEGKVVEHIFAFDDSSADMLIRSLKIIVERYKMRLKNAEQYEEFSKKMIAIIAQALKKQKINLEVLQHITLGKHKKTVVNSDSYNRRSLHIAVAEGDYVLCEILIQAGANVNAQDAQNRTPLHWTACTYTRHPELQNLLNEKTAANKKIQKALEEKTAQESEKISIDIARLLLGAGADIRALNIWGDVPWYDAHMRNKKSLAAFLKLKEAELETTESVPVIEAFTELKLA